MSDDETEASETEAVGAVVPPDEGDEDDDFGASEGTIPDLDLDLDLDAIEQEAKAKAKAKASEEDPSSTIPAPALSKKPGSKLGSSGAELGGWRPDGLAIAAIVIFVLVGAVLVFNFARALVPAAEAQLGAACRPIRPEPLTGPAPAIELEDLEGNPVSLANYQGKFLVVNFWATWCEPCTREWPDLDTLAHRMSERDDVAVLAISVDQELGDIAPYLERMGLGSTPVEILRAKDPAAHQAFGSEKIPDTYFVDGEGQLEAVFVNVRKWGRAKAVRCVEASANRQ